LIIEVESRTYYSYYLIFYVIHIYVNFLTNIKTLRIDIKFHSGSAPIE